MKRPGGAWKNPWDATISVAPWRVSGSWCAGRTKYVDETEPWKLARREGGRERLATVLYNLIEAVRVLTVWCTPFMPIFPDRVWDQMGIADRPDLRTWDSTAAWGQITCRSADPPRPRDLSKDS